MLIYTKFYVPKGNERLRSYENNPVEVKREDYKIMFSGPVEYTNENLRNEAFKIFNGIIPMNDAGKFWEGISACAGDIFEFIFQNDSRIIDLCLPFGWGKVSWTY